MLTIVDKRHRKTAEVVSGSYTGVGGTTTLPLGFVPTLLVIRDENGVIWRWNWGMGWSAHRISTAGDVTTSDSIYQYLGKELDDNPNQTGDDYDVDYISGDDEAGVVIKDDGGNGPNVENVEYRFWAIG